MLIRQRHVAQFANLQREDFVRRMICHLRELYPEYFHPRGSDGCRELIKDSIRKASEYGLQDEYAVSRYIDYRVLLGSEFESAEENAWIVRILRRSDHDQFEKVADIDRIQFGLGAAL